MHDAGPGRAATAAGSPAAAARRCRLGCPHPRVPAHRKPRLPPHVQLPLQRNELSRQFIRSLAHTAGWVSPNGAERAQAKFHSKIFV
jgi:hypothetical protein